MRQDLLDGYWFGEELDEQDITAVAGTIKGKLLPHASHAVGPNVAPCVVDARLFRSAAGIARGTSAARMSARREFVCPAEITNRRSCEGRPKWAVGRIDPALPAPAFPGWRHEVHDTVVPRRRGLTHAVSTVTCPP